MDIVIEASKPWEDGKGPNLDSPHQNLATAIVMMAVRDYKKTLRAMWKNPASKTVRRNLMRTKMELEEFFHSGDYGMYCSVDPDKLIRNCRKTAIEDAKKEITKKNKAQIRKEQKAKKQEDITNETGPRTI